MARSPLTLPAPPQATPARRFNLPSAAVMALSVVLILLGVMGGGLLSLKGKEQAGTIQGAVTRRSDSQQLVESTVDKLEADQTDLKRQIAEARAQLDQIQADSAQQKEQLSEVTSQIAAERITAGLVPLQGQGVIAIFQDSTTAAIPQGEDPNNYILHDYMLRDVVNTLWAGGAEAISLNGERILGATPLYCVGTTVICNATRLSPPYEFHAIGNPEALADGLRNSPQMEQFNLRAQIYDLPIEIRKETRVEVPAYSGSTALKHAQPADEAADAAATVTPRPATPVPTPKP